MRLNQSKTKRIHEDDTTIRGVIRSDLKRIIEIETQNFKFSWTEDELLDNLRLPKTISMAIEYNSTLVGYMIYELEKTNISLWNIRIASDYQRQGLGSLLIDRLCNKLSETRRRTIEVQVRETNLSAQLFFSAYDFRAISIIKKPFEESDEDAYIMRYTLPFSRIST